MLQRARAGSLDAVRHLNCWGMGLTDVCVLRAMSEAEVLSLSANGITTLVDMGRCVRLRELYLRKNALADLSQVAYLRPLKELRVLWISDNVSKTDERFFYIYPFIYVTKGKKKKMEEGRTPPRPPLFR